MPRYTVGAFISVQLIESIIRLLLIDGQQYKEKTENGSNSSEWFGIINILRPFVVHKH